MRIKIGLGYDIHRLVKGRKLILGGVEIHFFKGLAGHSDADVVLHAIADAILGALGEGDIGEHFPNTDSRYKNISSLVLLKNVDGLRRKKGFKISNVDCVVQAEEPKIKNYKKAMEKKIAQCLKIKISEVNIKATTQEQLDAIGQKKGIAAFATVLLIKN